MLTHLLLPLLLAPVQIQPYRQIVLPDNSVASYVVDCGDPNKGAVSEWAYFPGYPVIPPDAKFVQALVKGDRGWNDANLRNASGVLQTTRLGDASYGIAAPWLEGKTWLPAYVRFWSRNPYGASGNEVWPSRDAIRITGNRLTLYVTVNGSPCESVRLVGSGNDLTVFVVSGEQSRLMQDRPAVHVTGDRNTIRGSIQAPMTGLFVKGNDNRLLDLSVSAGSVGDDCAIVYLYGRGFNGTRLTNVTLSGYAREYPVSHLLAGLYADDGHSGITTWNVTISGCQTALFSHGGNNQTVRNLKAVNCERGVVFAPHFQTPTVVPTGNTLSQYTEVR